MSVLAVGMGDSDGYEITNSLRFGGDNDYLVRTPSNTGAAGNWTFSAWVKRSDLGSAQAIFSAVAGASAGTAFIFATDDTLQLFRWNGTAYNWRLTTTQVFRDTSAWYHIMVVMDMAQALTDRVKVYVNGSRVTSFVIGTYPTASYLEVNGSGWAHYLGRSYNAANYFNGYLAHVCWVDDQALAPSDFGYTDENNQWRSKSRTALINTVGGGWYNSSFLPFDDGTSTTTLGYDACGHATNWTPTNMVRASGTTECWMTDTPTNNFAVLNSISASAAMVYNGALTLSGSQAYGIVSIPMTTGKYYWEINSISWASQEVRVGISATPSTGFAAAGSYGWGAKSGTRWVDGVSTAGFATAAGGNNVGVAFDGDAGTLEIFKNNVSVMTITGIPPGIYFVIQNAGGTPGTDTSYYNFGQRAFSYTPPTGYKALSTKNLPLPTVANPNKHFDIKLHTGTAANQTIRDIPFAPDLVMIKARNSAQHTTVWDSIRGATKGLFTSTTGAEATDTVALTSFGSTSFSVGNGSGSYGVNTSTVSYVDWVWRAGGAAVTNTAGSITSQVSANPAGGFSIVSYIGTGANATVGHGLGVAPSMVIVKARSGGVADWIIQHSGFGSTKYASFNTLAPVVASNAWNDTAPTSSVVSIGNGVGVGANAIAYVAYCFAEVPGYSKIGTYTGNAVVDGPFVHCGFKPKYVMIKYRDGAQPWNIYDSARSPYNIVDLELRANTTDTDSGGTFPGIIDFTANGFKIRDTSAGSYINSAGVYIFIAFAEAPFKYSNAR